MMLHLRLLHAKAGCNFLLSEVRGMSVQNDMQCVVTCAEYLVFEGFNLAAMKPIYLLLKGAETD